jgi:4-hydroxy-4-methyl-2-oxoglutarate aldolase
MSEPHPPLPLPELLALRRWNTPTIYNGLEQYTKADRRTLVNLEDVTDFTPETGPMAGYALTVVVEPSNPEHQRSRPDAWKQFFRFVSEVPGPKIIVCQDLDKPRTYGACFGEVNCSAMRAFGCVGLIADGAVRDLDEIRYASLKVLARRLSVSHCYGIPVSWNTPVEVFGIPVQPGQLIHADKHGFLAVPFGEEARLPHAARFMDQNECDTLIAAARYTHGSPREIADTLIAAADEFGAAAKREFSQRGEWG